MKNTLTMICTLALLFILGACGADDCTTHDAGTADVPVEVVEDGSGDTVADADVDAELDTSEVDTSQDGSGDTQADDVESEVEGSGDSE